ncbi:tetratricopeptide repeat protein [Aquiflexum lacus]|uniref:tetratricopeptide repeat protein n=1 Tax=Aquiflexum lacus TaxID=2483805 RepID=UPI001E52D4C4|nr:tetratricopeptide repeat protein [Aquiflexum lacus]
MIPSSLTEVSDRNKAIKTAAKDYASTEYEASVASHMKLISDFELSTPNVNYNLALSYHYNGQLEEATRTYSGLLNAPDKELASFAYNQSGVILGEEKKYEEALESFKMALIKNHLNESARYNYELLSRWLEENPDQNDQNEEGEDGEEQQDQEDQDQQDQDKKSDDSKDGEGDEETEEDEASESQKKDDKSGEESQQEEDSEEPSDLESDLSDREKAMEKMRENLKEMNLTPEQAAQILEAMNAAELRYIQQNQKKATKRPERGLPDW